MALIENNLFDELNQNNPIWTYSDSLQITVVT
jgi:hypothetical protein